MEKEREVRLRRQIEELVRSRLGLLEQDISRLQREVNESFTRLLERTDTAATLPESDQMLSQIEAEVTGQIDQASAEGVRLGADIALLRDSVAELNEQGTQAEVLNALVSRAANFAPRVVLFVVKATNVLAWAARGLEESGGNSSIRGLAIPLQAETLLRDALNAQQTFYGSPDAQPENNLIFGRFGGTDPGRVMAVPLKVRGKAAAVLYADSADRGEEATNVEAIELLVQSAGLVVELVSLRARLSGGAQPAPAAPRAESPATPPPAASQASPPGGAPSSAQAQPEAEAEVSQPAPETAHHFKPAAETATTAGAQAAEAQASQPPAQPAPSPDTTPGYQDVGSGEAAANPPASSQLAQQPSRSGPLSEEERQHNDARRFARLLVSEIKLYNEQKVADGRRNNDLYDRLKEDIDRSRQMYDKRVSPTVAARFDYFYDELVNTLAEGDAEKLGSDYPGPSVRV